MSRLERLRPVDKAVATTESGVPTTRSESTRDGLTLSNSRMALGTASRSGAVLRPQCSYEAKLAVSLSYKHNIIFQDRATSYWKTSCDQTGQSRAPGREKSMKSASGQAWTASWGEVMRHTTRFATDRPAARRNPGPAASPPMQWEVIWCASCRTGQLQGVYSAADRCCELSCVGFVG